MTALLVAWFYFATVDHEQVWGFGPFTSQQECMQHRSDTVPIEVEATECSIMTVHEEDYAG